MNTDTIIFWVGSENRNQGIENEPNLVAEDMKWVKNRAQVDSGRWFLKFMFQGYELQKSSYNYQLGFVLDWRWALRWVKDYYYSKNKNVSTQLVKKNKILLFYFLSTY